MNNQAWNRGKIISLLSSFTETTYYRYENFRKLSKKEEISVSAITISVKLEGHRWITRGKHVTMLFKDQTEHNNDNIFYIFYFEKTDEINRTLSSMRNSAYRGCTQVLHQIRAIPLNIYLFCACTLKNSTYRREILLCGTTCNPNFFSYADCYIQRIGKGG